MTLQFVFIRPAVSINQEVCLSEVHKYNVYCSSMWKFVTNTVLMNISVIIAVNALIMF